MKKQVKFYAVEYSTDPLHPYASYILVNWQVLEPRAIKDVEFPIQLMPDSNFTKQISYTYENMLSIMLCEMLDAWWWWQYKH